MNWRSISIRGRRWLAERQIDQQIQRVEAYLAGLPELPVEDDDQQPVVFFNASTRVHRVSLNAAFSLVASWGLRARGFPVRYLVCWQGMDQCVLGAISKGAVRRPPCRTCTRLSQRLFPVEHRTSFSYSEPSENLTNGLEGVDVEAMQEFEWQGLPLGKVCLPSVRWVLRRHTLMDDQITRSIYQRFLRSAASMRATFEEFFQREQPRALVIFNGVTFPEAVARLVAQQMGIPVITHEVGIRPYSAFFSHDDATFRQVQFGDEFQLGPQQNNRLDEYLSERFQGRFSMAGVQFWPEMQQLPDWLLNRIAEHDQCVAVFSNVIFDTSQVHANTHFEGMFEWLDDILHVAEAHPRTLFVIRAHPDEDRPGKASTESVADWARERQVEKYPNVAFFPPSEYVSSYDLMRQAKFTIVYNSSIGLEGTLMGRPVLSAGRSRYTQIPTVFYPATRAAYDAQLLSFLRQSEINLPAEFLANARRFFYFEMYHASLDLSEFLGPYPGSRYDVIFNSFEPARALHDSEALDTIVNGIIRQTPFYAGMP